ncbi:MAG: cytidylate kinase-like family protein [Phycisphaerae bacterium]|nr:cytidylate kinase-like family protein [Phycisphaerae bacterium]
MTIQSVHNREINSIVESQMRQWVISSDQQARSEIRLASDDQSVVKYISISRDLGSCGGEIGNVLAELMDWQIYDKEILDHMAKDMDIHKNVLESVDERTTGFIEEWLTPFFTKKQVAQDTYYHHLLKTLMVIANHGRAIIIGRAAGMILPPKNGLRIRVTSPIDLRIQRIAQRNNISLDQAKRLVKNSDKARRDFAHKFLGKDVFDSLNYDLVINSKYLSPQAIAKLIWRALDQRLQIENN